MSKENGVFVGVNGLWNLSNIRENNTELKSKNQLNLICSEITYVIFMGKLKVKTTVEENWE